MVVLFCILLAVFLFFCLGLLSKSSLPQSAPRQGRAKQQAVRKYIKHVGPDLRNRYGSQKYYSPTQVKQTIGAGGYGSDFDCYALAMFCSQDDFMEYHRTTGESCNYDVMRSEITGSCGASFQSDGAFDANDMIDFSDRVDTSFDTTDSSSMWSGSSDNGSSGSDYSSDSSDYSSGSDYSGGGGSD